jgi:hypothetical protein
MKGFTLKLLLIVLMLVPVVPFSCVDKCMEDNLLYRQPFFQMQDLVFAYVDEYSINKKTGKLDFKAISRDYENFVYTSINMAMYFQAPDTALLFHDTIIVKNNIKNRFSLMPEAIACNRRQNGYAGTLDLVERIRISSEYDFDETHLAYYDMSDIVRIFAYTTNGENSWADLDVYNQNSPYEAPKRFYLLLKRNPTLSKIHRFRVRYVLRTPEGKTREFEVRTPLFNVR